MKFILSQQLRPATIGVAFLLVVVLLELVRVLTLNHGMLVYTLDDPYIHLAVAEMIAQGHYGINTGEFSAPSSSLFWPFLLAPFARYSYAPFVVNLIVSMGTVIVFTRVLRLSALKNTSPSSLLLSVMTIMFVLATNMVGLIFTGMEHSLQVFAVTLVGYGLILESERASATRWLWVWIAVLPLIRYECAAVSAAAFTYLIMRAQFRLVLISALILVIGIASFSVFLSSIGLDPLPSSVVAKSSVVQSGGALGRFVENLLTSIHHRQGVVLGVLGLILLFWFGWAKDKRKRQLALASLVAIGLHAIAGRYGWYHRYEIYVLAFGLMMVTHLTLPAFYRALDVDDAQNTRLLSSIGLVVAIGLVVGAPYIQILYSMPKASNNVYEQQYQMHRFVVQFYKKPVAVNDLGYVSYQNENHVLDLWGLGSQDALKARLKADKADWKDSLVEAAKVELIMIYEDWFEEIPKSWLKIGELHLGRGRVTPARSFVSFYVVNERVRAEVLKTIKSFRETLPDETKFILANEEAGGV